MKTLLLAVLSIAMLSGCAWMDINNDGKVDPLAYLADSDITVGWVDEDGVVYNVALDDLGKQIVGQFIEVKTGFKVELVETGGIIITDRNGFQLRVAREE